MEDKGNLVMPKTKKKFSYYKMIAVAFLVMIPALGFFAYYFFVSRASVSAETGIVETSVQDEGKLQTIIDESKMNNISEIKSAVSGTDLGGVEIGISEL